MVGKVALFQLLDLLNLTGDLGCEGFLKGL